MPSFDRRVAGKWRRSIQGSELLGGAAVLGVGTALGHAIALLVLPVATRLYSPSEWGVYTLFVSVVQLTGIASTLRLELGVVSQKSKRAAAQLAVVAFGVSLIVAPAVASICWIWLRAGRMQEVRVAPLAAYWLVPALWATAAFGAARYLVLRGRSFGEIARTTVSQNVARSGFQLLGGYFSAGWGALVVSEVLGRAAGLGRLLKSSWPAIRAAIRTSSLRDLYARAWENRDFARYSLPSSLADTATVTLLPVLVAQGYGAAAAGMIGLAQRAIAVPTVLLGDNVADAFHARLAYLARSEPAEVLRFFDRTFLLLLSVSILPSLALALLGKEVFQAVFGRQWALAGSLAAALAPWLAAQLTVSPLSRAVLVFSGQRAKLKYDAVSLALMGSTWVIAMHLQASITAAVLSMSVARTVGYGLYFFVLRDVVSRGVEMVRTS